MLVDATAVPANRGGVGRYVDQLLAALHELGADLAVACQNSDVAHYGTLLPSAQVVAAPAAAARRPARLAWEQVGLAGLADRVGARLIHSPHYTMPLRTALPVVTTLHDATFFTHPDLHQPVKRTFFRSWTKVSLRAAARCIVPSRATLEELVRVAGAVPGQVDVAHHGVDPATFHLPAEADVRRAREELGLRAGSYLAFLGTIEPRKNVPALVAGWCRAVSDRADPPALVIAGARGWDTTVDRAVAAVPDHLEVRLPGYLPLDQLAGFLGGAELVAYPSTAEGFGLPVLEAMACGAPVVTTTSLALPEIGGDAVEYTQPTVEGIAGTVGGLLDRPARRAELSAAALRRAARFTWAACAEQHLRTYAHALSS
ncbi:glycosyltransferase family 4 protein [Blastococcus capsensis]|uniref:glycosyltransferase family 4 protein n=1 Tax=Blastococcus capsensis TaxID=1564163 RepID=UPI002540BF1B|nr:glycosyltransferase family 1 protein [Blastococcus capsensis]MDK3256131.1 glycosyltransferase family 1 protein [Blastococcus capsensis]